MHDVKDISLLTFKIVQMNLICYVSQNSSN